MSEIFFDIMEVEGDMLEWSEELFFLSLDPIYLKTEKFRDAVDKAKHNLDNGNAEFEFYMRGKDISDNQKKFWEKIPDLRLGSYNGDKLSLDIAKWNMCRVMLESALTVAKDNLAKVEEEASCITNLMAKKSWRTNVKKERK